MRRRAILQHSLNHADMPSDSPGKAKQVKQVRRRPGSHKPEQRHSFYSHAQFAATNGNGNTIARSHSQNSLRPMVQPAASTRPAVGMTPFQIQRQKMRTRFQFDNGEVFIPRREQKNANGPVEKPNPYAATTNVSPPLHTQPAPAATKARQNQIAQLKKPQAGPGKEKEKKKLGSFFKRLFKSKDNVVANEDSVVVAVTAPEANEIGNENGIENGIESKTEEVEADVYTRLSKQWEKVHYIAPDELNNTSRSSSNQSSILTSSLPDTSQLTIPSLTAEDVHQKPMNLAHIVRTNLAVTLSKKFRFADFVYLTDTWAAEVYERSDDGFLDNFIEVESSNPLRNESGANTTTQKPEIKKEINEFKRTEMVVHEHSRHMTHFYS